MVRHPHPRQPSTYSQLRACSLYLPSLLLCLTFELIPKSYCHFFSLQGRGAATSQTKVEGPSAAPWAHGNGRWGEPGQVAGPNPLPTLLAWPPVPGARCQSITHHVGDPWTFYQQPVATCCPRCGTARRRDRGPGVQRSGACRAAAKVTLVEVGKISTLSFWDRAR